MDFQVGAQDVPQYKVIANALKSSLCEGPNDAATVENASNAAIMSLTFSDGEAASSTTMLDNEEVELKLHLRIAPDLGPVITLRKMYAHIRKQCACGDEKTSSTVWPFLLDMSRRRKKEDWWYSRGTSRLNAICKTRDRLYEMNLHT